MYSLKGNLFHKAYSKGSMDKSILIAEDDVNTSDLLARYFSREGFETIRANNGIDALRLARNHQPNFVILDLMMPGIQGWDVCEQLRTCSNVPILILSARQEEADRILGLNLGADDYVVKPFSPREVVARVHAILRRAESSNDIQDEILEHSELTMDCANRSVSLSDQPIHLTSSEFTLLKTLIKYPGRAFSRAELLDKLYSGNQVVIDRVVDVHIASIRQKLESVCGEKQYISTVRGVGYRLEK